MSLQNGRRGKVAPVHYVLYIYSVLVRLSDHNRRVQLYPMHLLQFPCLPVCGLIFIQLLHLWHVPLPWMVVNPQEDAIPSSSILRPHLYTYNAFIYGRSPYSGSWITFRRMQFPRLPFYVLSIYNSFIYGRPPYPGWWITLKRMQFPRLSQKRRILCLFQI